MGLLIGVESRKLRVESCKLGGEGGVLTGGQIVKGIWLMVERELVIANSPKLIAKSQLPKLKAGCLLSNAKNLCFVRSFLLIRVESNNLR